MKLFVKLLIALLTLFILAIVVLFTVVDPNDYKPEIQAQVKKAINRELVINGDLGWTFFPQLGFSSGEIKLKNISGFNRDNLAKIDDASVGLAILPLFKGQIEIGQLTLNGLRFNLITNESGVSNLDNMVVEKPVNDEVQQDNQTEKTSSPQGSDAVAVESIKLAGININNATIEIQDFSVGSTTEVNIESIKLGRFELGKETELSIITNILVNELAGRIELQSKIIVATDLTNIQLNDFNLETLFAGEGLPNKQVTSTIKSKISYNLETKKADISDLLLMLDEIELRGSLSVQTAALTKVRFDLQGNEWDLTPYLPPKTETAESTKPQQPTQTSSSTSAEQEPDLGFLHDLDIQGDLSIAGIKANAITVGNIAIKVMVNKGKAQIKPLTAQLYDGKLTVNAEVDDANGKNKYKVASTLKDVTIRQLLIDAAEIDLLSGKTAFNFNGSGTGLTSNKIKSGLQGKGDFALLDGELYGVNIPQEIRTFKAKLKGKTLPTEENIKKTDFASLTGNFSIKKGQVNNQKLLMLSPVMRLDGAGIANILKEALDYKLSITPLSKSTEETELHDLSGITIPLLIKGSFSDPKFSIDMDGALKEQIKAKSKDLENKAKELLKNPQDKSSDDLKEEGKKIEKSLKKELGNLFG